MTNCEWCVHFAWDEAYGAQVCCASLDEDEMDRFLNSRTRDCPFFQMGDEYKLVQKQN